MNNVLSLCDGVSIGQVALHKLGIKYDNYYASEIEQASIEVTQHHFPNTIQLGNMKNVNGKLLNDIKLIIAGTPCTDFSFMGKKKGMTTKCNVTITDLYTYLKLKSEGFEFEGSSYLFWDFIRLWKETNAKYFFLENVKMTKQWENIITKTLGVEPILINSSLLSAQNRERLYWTNIPNISIPEDKGILLTDVIPDAIACGKRGRKLNGDNKYSYPLTYRKDGKSNCVVTAVSNTGLYIKNGELCKLTADEAEVLQTFDKGYTKVNNISETKRYQLIGNSWTLDVIQHLFIGLKSKKNKYDLYFR